LKKLAAIAEITNHLANLIGSVRLDEYGEILEK